MASKKELTLEFFDKGYRPSQLREMEAFKELKNGTLYRYFQEWKKQPESESKPSLIATTNSASSKAPPNIFSLIKDFLEIPDVLIQRLLNVYSPFRKVPTLYHLAQIVLSLGAVSDRTRPEREDHYLSFLQVGRTLRWKSSSGVFCSYMFGMDPNTHVIDLSAESGLSLWLRRGPQGEITIKREILEAPFVCFEDFWQADKAVRTKASHFWSGRRKIAVENQTVQIQPVTLLCANPKEEKATDIKKKLGFTEQTLRRFIVLDVDRIELPDLRKVGQEALDLARRFGPIEIRKPTVSCKEYRCLLVDHAERLFNSRLVDVEGLLGVARGLTGYGFTPEEAIKLVLYLVSFPYQTIGWINPEFGRPNPKPEIPAEEKPKVQTEEKPRTQKPANEKEEIEFLKEREKLLVELEEIGRSIEKESVDKDLEIDRRSLEVQLKYLKDKIENSRNFDTLKLFKELFPALQADFSFLNKKNEEIQQLRCLEKMVRENRKKLDDLTRCADYLDRNECSPTENIQKTLEEFGCIRKIDAGFKKWRDLLGREYSEDVSWTTWEDARPLLWVKLQNERTLLEKIFPVLPPGLVSKFTGALNPLQVLEHKWKLDFFGLPVHSLLISNVRQVKFAITLVFVYFSQEGTELERKERKITVPPGNNHPFEVSFPQTVPGAKSCRAELKDKEPEGYDFYRMMNVLQKIKNG